LIAQIVQQLNPRLYIDFIRYLPAEICLKILGYLDPVSLISVAQSCRAWYDLAMDRKLWERLFFLEGWKSVPREIQDWERRVNSATIAHGSSSFGAGQGPIKLPRSLSPRLDHDRDYVMLDADRPVTQEPTGGDREMSLFGGSAPVGAKSHLTLGFGGLNVAGSGSSSGSQVGSPSRAVEKGKGKATSPPPPRSAQAQPDLGRHNALSDVLPSPSLPRSALWLWDPTSDRHRINWKYLYTMRRRLESNWDRGRFVNFQFPHPDHLEEGHGECIYSIQFDSDYLVSGSRDRTLRIWGMKTRRLVRPPLTGHRGSVLCLQFDSSPEEDIIVSGSSDSDVILWRFSTGQIIQRLNQAHKESVLNVKFDKHILVTCSKDKTIKIFNRRELRPGDLGYGEVAVNPVPTTLKNYGYDGLDQLPLRPPYTLIGSLEGHSAAVNAVQICGREVVSASGDRNLKVWDWPNQTCLRTFIGHHKGIACVQYDGKRIVSGSSDNEVKIFDRKTGLEVASLRSHSNLVRTVQAGFGDLPYSGIEDAVEAQRVDALYHKAVESGAIPTGTPARRSRQPNNPGSKRPEDIMAYGAKLPPGGGGGPYGRIVSGSYDTTIIIWRRDKEGIWKDQHRLKQEDAAAAAAAAAASSPSPQNGPASWLRADRGTRRRQMGTAGATIALPPPSDVAVAGPAQGPSASQSSPLENRLATQTTDLPHSQLVQLIDVHVPQGVHALQHAINQHPSILELQPQLQAAIDREASPFVRSQLRQAVSTALVRNQLMQARATRNARTLAAVDSSAAVLSALGGPSNSERAGSGEADRRTAETSHAMANPSYGSTGAAVGGVGATGTQDDAAMVVDDAAAPPPPPVQPAAVVAGPPPPTVAAHNAHNAAPAARQVSPPHAYALRVPQLTPRQLQFDAHRIICCSQTSVIVGWDFCNGDAELAEVARLFATVD